MKHLFDRLASGLIAPTGPAPWGRAGATLLLGILLLTAPETAAKILTFALWLPGLIFLVLFFRFRKHLPQTGKIILLLMLTAGGLLLFCHFHHLSWARQALPGAGLWAAAAAVELLIRTGAPHSTWPMRLTGLAGGLLSAAAGYAFLMKKGGGFYGSSDLLGVFFIALGCLMLTGLASPSTS